MPDSGELTRRYFANTLAQAVLKGASALVGLWAARELVFGVGPVEFGLMGLSGALSGYMAFLGLGLPSGLVRQVADLHARGEAARLRRLVRTTLFVFLAIGAAGALCLTVLALTGGLRFLALPAGSEDSARAAFLATAAVVLVSWPLSAFSAALTGLQKIPAQNAVAGVAALASAVVSVAAARSGAGAAGIILAMGGVATVAGLAQALVLRRYLPRAAARDGMDAGGPGQAAAAGSRDDLKALFSFGAWVLVLELASLVIYQTDHVLLSVLVSVQSITSYVIAARLHNLMREANGVFATALFPMIAAEEARGNPAAAEQALYRGTRYAAALLAPATVVAMILAADFLRVWMGEEFVALAPWTRLFVSYFLLAVLTTFAGQVALGRGYSAILGKIAIGSAVVNLVVGLLLVRRFGVGGVIAGTVAAYLFGVPAQVMLLFPRLGVDLKRFVRETVLPVYGPLAPLGVALWLVLRSLPPVSGVLDLLFRGAVSCVLLWIPLWWTAVEPRDRRRILSRLPLCGSVPS